MTADLSQPDVDLHLDITQLELRDAAFDAALCSHVLEHVSDDRAAMGELRRIMAPGDWCRVMEPLDPGREHTYEDISIVAADDRHRAFWQHDHVRLYAADIAERLAAAGFIVARIRRDKEFCAETGRSLRDRQGERHVAVQAGGRVCAPPLARAPAA